LNSENKLAERALKWFIESSYILMLCRYKGALFASDLVETHRFESLLHPIVQSHAFFLRNGKAPERFPMVLGLQKLAYLKDDSLTLEDLQLTHIAMESLPFLIASDYEDLRTYAYSIFHFMNEEDYIDRFNAHLNKLSHVGEREGLLSYDRFKQITSL